MRRRLEAATSRLEDIATSTELPKDVPVLNQAVASSAPTPTPPSAAAPTNPTPKAIEEPIPESIEEFQQFINLSVGKYVGVSKELGGVVAKQV
jgi:adenylyl cyclase-associated protein